ncbi:hypothetical protein KGP24_00470 [Enterobacter sp. JBIWA008]|uniref:hypothetical protein n=1 Tax=Enterobacter sp. JBIWA008 TaxID=2831892 RepID=UPI001CBCC05F|nr:hypothetical protein [Enterobacter sp. JBIWA008]UAN41009.1 hypothetical protein KGP24_00470 [Enterobacter sp. JBIWA008]
MAVNFYNGSQGIIKSRDVRVCGFYADWLMTNNRIDTRNVPRQDADSCRKVLNELINQYIPDKEQQIRLLQEMEMSREENILPLESFDWLRQDERATFWLWGYLCKVSDEELGIPRNGNKLYSPNWYTHFRLSMTPASHRERLDIIGHLFDRIIVASPPVTYFKKMLMERLKDKWKMIYSKPLPLKWLPDEEEAVLWAWNNLSKTQQISTLEELSLNINSGGLTTWFTPLSHTERNLALRAALDLWVDAPDSKRLFLLNLNKAWNQQKLRQSRTDKKALNTYLKNETKTRLDFMAERSGVRISDMLEMLINEHYRKTCGGE